MPLRVCTVPASPAASERPLFLLADIGGTNARFAFAEPSNPLPQPIANYAVEDFPSFEGVLNQLVEDWQELKDQKTVLQRACLAVAAIPSSAKSASPTTRGGLLLIALLLGWVAQAFALSTTLRQWRERFLRCSLIILKRSAGDRRGPASL